MYSRLSGVWGRGPKKSISHKDHKYLPSLKLAHCCLAKNLALASAQKGQLTTKSRHCTLELSHPWRPTCCYKSRAPVSPKHSCSQPRIMRTDMERIYMLCERTMSLFFIGSLVKQSTSWLHPDPRSVHFVCADTCPIWRLFLSSCFALAIKYGCSHSSFPHSSHPSAFQYGSQYHIGISIYCANTPFGS